MKKSKYYVDASLYGGVLRVSRLGHCPMGRGWCNSYCQMSPHRSAWKKVLEIPFQDRDILTSQLRPLLLGGINHVIDVEHLVDGGLVEGGFCEWVLRGEDLDSKVKINNWLRKLKRLIKNHRRLRLYRDDHGWSSAAI